MNNLSPTSNNLDVARLSGFSPFNALKTDNLGKLLAQVETRRAGQGEILFKKGDSDKCAVYVISGSVSLSDGDNIQQAITGGTDAANHPIAPMLPRQQSAIAVDEVHYFTIDSELLDVTITLDQTGIYEVGDFSADLSDDDWMMALLKTQIFQQIPPQNIQTIFMRLQRVDFKAGDVVIQQGSKGDFFYIVTSGRCLVARETPANKDGIALAELGVGDTFGEEALISEDERNATITMQTDGIIMRLGRDDFQSLLNEPTLVSLDHDVADEAASQGGHWLDVRVPSEFKAFSKADATNLPLYLLRHKLDVLDRDTPYIVYCDTGRRSSAAAFILNQNGFQTAVLKGGLNRSDA